MSAQIIKVDDLFFSRILYRKTLENSPWRAALCHDLILKEGARIRARAL